MVRDDSPTILVVEDEEMALDTYLIWLGDDFDVRTATDGVEALEEIDDSVSVVLLDRRMPNMTGDEVLEEFREREYDCKVAMVSAVEPDMDIVDMPFDAYLKKPVTGDELVDVVERLSTVATHDEVIQELFAVVEKQTVLEQELGQTRVEKDEEYRALIERREELSRQADSALGTTDKETFEAVIRDV